MTFTPLAFNSNNQLNSNTDSVSKPVMGSLSNLSRFPSFGMENDFKWSTGGIPCHYEPNSTITPPSSTADDEFSADLVDLLEDSKPILHPYLLVRGALTEKETSFDDLLKKVRKGLRKLTVEFASIPKEIVKTNFNFLVASDNRGSLLLDASYVEIFSDITTRVKTMLENNAINIASGKVLPKYKMNEGTAQSLVLDSMDESFVLAHLSVLGTYTDKLGRVYTNKSVKMELLKSTIAKDLNSINLDHATDFDDLF